MSLVRAFTNRRNKPEVTVSAPIGRAASQRHGKPVIRTQISSPVALVSTTNMLSYNAPDIIARQSTFQRDFSPSSSNNSSCGDETDASANSVHSNDTQTDMSSVDDSPTSPSPNHLSCYFKPAVETNSNTPAQSPLQSPSLSAVDAPILPQRAASHSKKAHEKLSRQRSVRGVNSPPSSARTSSEQVHSIHSADLSRENPFDKELEQLDEVAEEFGHTVRKVEAHADTTYLLSHNLAEFGASDYLNEIRDLLEELFPTQQPEVAAWI